MMSKKYKRISYFQPKAVLWISWMLAREDEISWMLSSSFSLDFSCTVVSDSS